MNLTDLRVIVNRETEFIKRGATGFIHHIINGSTKAFIIFDEPIVINDEPRHGFLMDLIDLDLAAKIGIDGVQSIFDAWIEDTKAERKAMLEANYSASMTLIEVMNERDGLMQTVASFRAKVGS